MNATPALSKRRCFMLWLAFACVIIALDQWIKLLIVDNFYYGQSITYTSFFNLVRAHNTGAAFSMLADAGGWQKWFFSGIAIAVSAIIIGFLWKSSQQKLLSAALALLLGGAIGNLIDRLTYGYVVDYLDFHWNNAHFPAFNLADTAICIGAGLLILHELLQWMKERREKNTTNGSI